MSFLRPSEKCTFRARLYRHSKRLPGFLPRLVPIVKLVMPEMRPFKDADFDDAEVRAGFERLMPDIDLKDPEVQIYLREQVTLPLSVIHEVFRLGAEAHRLARSVAAPTLVIQGRDDQMVRPKLTQRLVERLGGTQRTYQEIPGPHELVHEHSKQNAIVTEFVTDFLNGRQ